MKQMTLNNIYEWPIMTRLLLLGLIFALVFYAGYRLDLSAQIQALSRAEQQEADLKQQIELVINKSKMLEVEVSRLPALKKELGAWNKQLIARQDLPELLNSILKIGGDNHLFFSLFTPGEMVQVTVPSYSAGDAAADKSKDAGSVSPAPAGQAAQPAAPQDAKPKITFTKVPIKVVVVGNYHQIADFISQVANMPWIVVVGNFTINQQNDSALLGEKMAKQAEAQHLLSAEMTLDVYHLPESK